MRIGVPKEIKNNEFRVAITAAGVHEFRTHGHTVLVERGAGLLAFGAMRLFDAGAQAKRRVAPGRDHVALGDHKRTPELQPPSPSEAPRSEMPCSAA